MPTDATTNAEAVLEYLEDETTIILRRHAGAHPSSLEVCETLSALLAENKALRDQRDATLGESRMAENLAQELKRLIVEFANRQNDAVRAVADPFGHAPPIEERIRLLEWRVQDMAVCMKDMALLLIADMEDSQP